MPRFSAPNISLKSFSTVLTPSSLPLSSLLPPPFLQQPLLPFYSSSLSTAGMGVNGLSALLKEFGENIPNYSPRLQIGRFAVDVSLYIYPTMASTDASIENYIRPALVPRSSVVLLRLEWRGW